MFRLRSVSVVPSPVCRVLCTRHGVRRAIALLLLAGTGLLCGCLGKPEIEDRWTRIDIVGSSLAPNQLVHTGAVQPVSVQVTVTYRSILTGVAVAELRASSVPASAVEIHPDANRVRMAGDIDFVLQNSVSVGRATRAVTGWDHLIQPINFTFVGVAPATLDSTGAPAGLFLLCYLGSGQRIELPNGADSLVVTPFPSAQYEVLPVGVELITVPPGSF